ncbi:MAG: S8 family serine peptidase [Anaerolineae bacterium]
MSQSPIRLALRPALPLLLGALLLLGGLSPAGALPPPPVDEATPVGSWLVRLQGPSLHQRLTEQLGRRDLVGATLPPPAELKAMEDAVRRGQEPVLRAIQRLGGRTISRYAASVNGLLVHATAAQSALIARLPGVLEVEAAPIVRPELGTSAPHVGARRLAQELGVNGTGSVVAVIDTGVDYTHAHLGGPGDPAAFQFASGGGNGERVDDKWQDKLLLPNSKVIGGYDFVGPRYNPPHICTDVMMGAGQCTNIPEPDPDPLDAGGHGTHVSGIIAGAAIPAIPDGIAPGAQIVGLKLYGTNGGDEAADVLVDAIEWTYRVNVKIEDRGVLPPQVDAINISLGENWGQGSRLFDEAVSSATDNGVIVVASAGNAGDQPFVVGAPSASPRILSVASTVPPAFALMVEARWADQKADYPAVDSTVAALAGRAPIDAALAFMGRACNGDAIEQDVSEKVALVARGDCVFPEKILNAQKAGAIAVLVFTNQNARTPMGGDSAGIDIAAVMIDNAPGLALRDLLLAGTEVAVRMDPSTVKLDESIADAVSGFSSRGPSKNGALKPDIAAPGSSINSGRMGSGTGGVSFSGTSMAGPMVAGTAALMQHRNRKQNLGLGAADLGAMLMNYSRPVIYQDPVTRAPITAVRQGAGLVDIWRAGTAQFVARAGDIASINLGAMALSAPANFRQTVTVKPLDKNAPMRLALALDRPGDTGFGPAVKVTLPKSPMTIAPGETVSFDVVFDVDPAALPDWTLYPSPLVSDPGPIAAHEVQGHVLITPIDDQGQPLADVPQASVPFYLLPRKASDFSAQPLAAALSDTVNAIRLRNDGLPGTAELFAVPRVGLVAETDRQPSAAEDADEPEVLRELDLRRVGLRLEPGAEGSGPLLSVAIARHETAAIAHVTNLAVYIDADRDGKTDHVLREAVGGSPVQVVTEYAGWDPTLNEGRGEIISGTLKTDLAAHRSDQHTRLSVLTAPAAGLGIGEQGSFAFHVVATPLNEDWLSPPHPKTVAQSDVAPDGADQADGPRYVFNPADMARIPAAWSLRLPAESGSARGSIALGRGPGETDYSWLLAYPGDDFATTKGQIQVLEPGREGPVYLPLLLGMAQLMEGP